LRVDLSQVARGGNGFWETFLGVAFGENSKSFKDGRLDEVAIDDPQPADARAAEGFCVRRSQSSATHDQNARSE